MENPLFRQTVSTKTVTVGQRYLRNHNKLLWQLEGADGVKTGYTRAAGRILVSSATRDGRRMIAVTINAPDDWNDHCMLINQSFSMFTPQKILSAGERVGFVDIVGGAAGSVELRATEDFSYPLAESETVSLELAGSGFVYAPVAEGGDAGWVHICIDGRSVAKVPIVYGRTVEIAPKEKKSVLDRLFGG